MVGWGTSPDKRSDPLSYLPPTALRTLAALLCYPSPDGSTQPTESWLAQQKARLDALSPSLKLHRTLSLATFFSLDQAVAGRLCGAHRRLNPELLFWCYTQLHAEATTHADRLRRHLARLQADRSSDFAPTAELAEFLARVTGIAGLLLRPAAFEREFARHVDVEMLPERHRLGRVRGGCAACVLAVVGARAQMLIDLRSNMLGRARRGRKPRFLPLVEAWIDEFGEAAAREMRAESDEIVGELREIRAAMEEREGRGRHGREKGGGGRREHRRRRKQRERVGVGRLVAAFLGFNFGDDKKKRHHDSGRPRSSGGRSHHGDHDGSSGGRHRSSSFHGSSTARPSSAHFGSSSSSTGSAAQSEYIDRHLPLPAPSHAERVASWGSPAAGADVASNEQQRQQRQPNVFDYQVPSSSAPSATARRPTRYGAQLLGGGDGGGPRRPSIVPPRLSAAGAGAERPYSVTSQGRPAYATSSVYSTDDMGLRAGDAGFRGGGAAAGGGANHRVPTTTDPRQIVADLGLGADDVPYDPDDYETIMCPSSESEDDDEDEDGGGGAVGEAQQQQEEEYVPARADWGKQTAAAAPASTAGGRGAARGGLDARGRPTVSACVRLVDEVSRGYRGLEAIDEAAAQFTPRTGGDGPPAAAGSASRARAARAPSTVGAGVPDQEVGPDDSYSVADFGTSSSSGAGRWEARASRAGGSVAGSVGGSTTASRRSAMGGGRFTNVIKRA